MGLRQTKARFAFWEWWDAQGIRDEHEHPVRQGSVCFSWLLEESAKHSSPGPDQPLVRSQHRGGAVDGERRQPICACFTYDQVSAHLHVLCECGLGRVEMN